MRTVLAIVAASALLASGCTSDGGSPEPAPEPASVTLTGDERDDFVSRVVDLGYTCREALPDTARYVACTRPGEYSDARDDVVSVTSSEDGEQVLRVAYCGQEEGVAAAASAAFLGEIGTPDLLVDPPRVEGASITRCGDQGVALGQPALSVLRELDLEMVRRHLVRQGWACRNGEPADCRPSGPARQEILVYGIPGEVRVVARSSRDLVTTTRLLGLRLSPTVVEAASACRPAAVCEHLVVDGFDVYVSADGGYRRLTIRERRYF